MAQAVLFRWYREGHREGSLEAEREHFGAGEGGMGIGPRMGTGLEEASAASQTPSWPTQHYTGLPEFAPAM